jgi:hypothetical protein
MDIDDNDVLDEDALAAQEEMMRQMMGFAGFDSTHVCFK